MTSAIFQEWAKGFAEQGRVIKQINSKASILFSVHPFLESFLGWDSATLSHFTVLDCVPLADLSEAEILSGSAKLRGVIQEAIAALEVEEEHVSALRKKELARNAKKNQMEWL
ncbi:MAG TPA: hypothetical protein VN809_15830 [Telmatospirillum sp.]|nr:hypothetical protein [Telmatospirillum sp.]